MVLILLLLLLIPASSPYLRSRNRTPREVPSGQLIPLSYDLTVRLPVTPDSFTASLVLHFSLVSPTSSISLDSEGLYSFSNISVVSPSQSDLVPRHVRVFSDSLQLQFPSQLPAGEYLLTIGEYYGRISNGSTGLFHRHGKLFTTHFQPSGARRVLPCLDHPSVRAPFRLSIVHPTDTVAQANTIATAVQVVDSRWQKTVFAATPALPSYLVAFSVMPDTYIQLSRQTSFGVTLRVHSSSRTASLRVLDVALPAIELLAELMLTPLPLNKIDLVLIDNYEGGMENWGHVCLSQSLAERGDDARLAYVVAHELAHHWIGGRTVVDNWQHICLQEDLTDFISYKVIRALLTDDSRYARFRLAKYVEIQLAEDFLSPGHSLLLPQNITNEMISSHCYLKGVVLLESLESVVGEPFMMSSIRSLLSAPSFRLSTFSSHFSQLHVDSNVTLEQVYLHWFTQGGFPALLVENGPSSTRISQLGDSLSPIRLSSNDVHLSQFMFAKELTVQSNGPLLLNLNFTSFVRVNYDNDTWLSIFGYMSEDPQLFSPVGRAQLVSDFCYFQAQNTTPESLPLRNTVIDLVYSHAEAFELCDWHLYWCRPTTDVSLFAALARRLALGLSGIFESESAFGCRSGMAVRNVNAFCQSIFGKKCV